MIAAITPEQRAALLENLRAGFALTAAARRAKTTVPMVRREAAADAAFAEELSAAEFGGRVAPVAIKTSSNASRGGDGPSPERKPGVDQPDRPDAESDSLADRGLGESAAVGASSVRAEARGKASAIQPLADTVARAAVSAPAREHAAARSVKAIREARLTKAAVAAHVAEIASDPPRMVALENRIAPVIGLTVELAKSDPPPTSDTPPPLTWDEACELAPAEDATPPPAPVELRNRWSAILPTLAPGLLGALLWVESRCTAAGMHPLDPQWLWHFSEYYPSNKQIDVGRFGLRAAKSASVCRALVAEVIFNPRRLEPGVVGVCPVMSKDMREAGDRFDTIAAILRACGLKDLTGTRAEEDGGFKRSGGGNAAHVIAMRDALDHEVEFRIYAASIAGAAGFTGIAGFCDEADLWGKEGAANPFGRVLEVLLTRYTTQPGARLHVMSAPYHASSAFGEMIKQGDTPSQRVARLGKVGAAKDEAERRRLAALFRLDSPLLTAAADPASVDIPSWVSNPTAPIESCYQGARGDLQRMFALYGGRPECAPDGAVDWAWFEKVNREAAARAAGTSRTLTGDDIRDAGNRLRGLPVGHGHSGGGGHGGHGEGLL